MDEFTIRALFLLSGIIIGWALGLLHSMNRYAKRTRDNTEYCRAVIQRRLDREGEVPLPPHAGDNGAVGTPDYASQGSTMGGSEAPTPNPGIQRDDRGALNLVSVGMILALAVVLFSMFSTIHTNNRVTDAGKARDRENTCTSTVLFATVDALNRRTAFSTDQATANIALQEAQLKFLSSIGKPPPTDGTDPLVDYLKALTVYLQITAKQRDVTQANSFPTQQQYASCLDQARSGD